MNSLTTTVPSQVLPEPDRRPRRAGQSEEPGKKPKKVNSEIRKQQNRIASRNYREKRKRKFQYLQQLIKDGPDDEQESKPSPGQHATYARSLSADYDVAGPSSSPYTLPSNSDFGSMSSSSTPASHPILPATTASFNSSHVHAITHTYPTFPMNWHAHIYSPPPPANWTVPSPWMSGSEYSARVAPRPEMYQHTPSLAQAAFEHTQPPSDEPNDFLSTSDIYGFGSSYPPQGQAPGNPNVSLPASSPYYQGHYPGSC